MHLDENEESKFQDYLYNFENHERSVNSVRFSPNGRSLATGSDGGVIFVFSLPQGRPVRMWKQTKCQRMVVCRLIRTTQSDIYDLAWAPTSRELCSVSVDNKVSFWDVTGSKSPLVTNFTSHTNYVQGVAWDPRDKFIVSQSNDRSCRIYARKDEKKKKGGKKKAAAAATATSTDPAAPPKPVPTILTEYTQLRLACRPDEKGWEGPEEEVEVSTIVPVKSSEMPSAAKLPPPPPHAAATATAEEGKEETAAKEDEEDDEVEVVGTTPGAAATTDAAAAAVVVPQKAKPRAPRANLYADETVPSFFRRPTWSPDGCLLVTPAGLYRRGENEGGGGGKTEFATHVYVRDMFSRPVLELPHPGSKASIGVRFCPQLFELKTREGKGGALGTGATAGEEGKEPSSSSLSPLTNLPYRMVWAVLTVNGILIYDTQHHFPLAVVKNSHYAPMTDATWVSDGSALIATSMDGYVTVICFPDNELGTSPVHPPTHPPTHLLTMLHPFHSCTSSKPPSSSPSIHPSTYPGTPLELAKVPPVVRTLHEAHYDKILRAAEEVEEEEAEEAEEKERMERRAARAAEKQQRRNEEEEGDGVSLDDSEMDVEGGKKKKGGSPSSLSSGGEGKGKEKKKTKAEGSDGESLASESASESEEEEDEEEEEEEEEEGEAKAPAAASSGPQSEKEEEEEEEEEEESSDDEWDPDAAPAPKKGEKKSKAKQDKKQKDKKRKSVEAAEEEEEEEEEDAAKPSQTQTAVSSTPSSFCSSPAGKGKSPRPSAAAASSPTVTVPPAEVSVSSAQKKKRIRPTPVGSSSGGSAADAFAAAAGSTGSSSSTAVEEQQEKEKGMEKEKAAVPRAAKPAKKRVAPTLVSSSLP